MAVFRINKTKDYTVMSNGHLKDKTMSLKAKGLLSVMLALPDDWDYSIAGLVAISKEEETAIENTIKELKKLGYLRVDRITPDKSESGRMEYVYNVFEQPQKQGVGFLGVENLGVEFLGVENRPQLNTNKLNTNELNTKNNKNEYGEYKNVRLTKEEYQKLSNDYGSVLAEKTIRFLDEYIEDKGYKSKSHYLAIKRWVVDAVREKEPKGKEFQKHEYKREVLVEQETPLEMF